MRGPFSLGPCLQSYPVMERCFIIDLSPRGIKIKFSQMDSVAQCVRELDEQTAELILASQNPSRSWVWRPLYETLLLGWWWAVGPGGSVSWKLGNSVFSKRIYLPQENKAENSEAGHTVLFFWPPQTHAWCTRKFTQHTRDSSHTFALDCSIELWV